MSPRTLDELRAVLEAEGVDPSLIAIGDYYGRYDTYCIAPCRRVAGALESAGWETFHAERGKHDRRTFQSEAEACAYFLSWVRSLAWVWNKASS